MICLFEQDGAPPLGWGDTISYLVLPVLLIVSQYISMQLMQPPQVGHHGTYCTVNDIFVLFYNLLVVDASFISFMLNAFSRPSVLVSKLLRCALSWSLSGK
jgi:hypothetical protein